MTGRTAHGRKPSTGRANKVSAALRQLTAVTLGEDMRFDEVLALIDVARGRVYETADSELVVERRSLVRATDRARVIRSRT